MAKIKKRVIIVGGGAAGMMAAIVARRGGSAVTILERNPRVGKKILATGNGRCNFTNMNTCPTNYYGSSFGFVASVLSAWGVAETLDFFTDLGISPQVEERGKVFPMSGQASSVLDVLRYELEELGVEIICDSLVENIKREQNQFVLDLVRGARQKGDALILATGGKTMPSSGSDGSGFLLAEKMGHMISPIFPALVQLKLTGDHFPRLQGVKVVGTAAILHQEQVIAQASGDVLFTNYGLSGPPILQISRQAGALLQAGEAVSLKLVLIDRFSRRELAELLRDRWQKRPQKTLEFSLVGLINKRLIPVVVKEAGLGDYHGPVGALTAEKRGRIVHILTDWCFPVRGTKGWSSAQVTAGGVVTTEIDEQTMGSKIVPGLYFAGEIVDVDGQCGGYNLQWAWSSGYLAGRSAALSVGKGPL